jgi:hypothetical protein
MTGLPGCVPDDGAGHAYISTALETTASGPPPRPGCGLPSLPPCPAGDARLLVFGLLGPGVAAIGYHDGDRVLRQRVQAPAGGYLLVFARTGRQNGTFSIGPRPSVGFAIRRIYYRDGSSCGGTVGPDRHPVACPLAGYTAPVRTLGGGSIRRRLKVTGRHRLRISFRAPVAIHDAGRAYALNVSGGRTCRFNEIGKETRRDFAKGARVTLAITLPPDCHGTVRGTIVLTSSAGAGGLPVAPGDPASRLVGRFTHEPAG